MRGHCQKKTPRREVRARSAYDMIVANTKENREIRDVAASMAIENMFLPKEFLAEVMKVSRGEKTSEELRREIIRQYGQA